MPLKLTPAQQKLLINLSEGKQLVRDCGLYWLRDPKIKISQRMERISTLLVETMLKKRLLKCAGRRPENPMMDSYVAVGTPETEQGAA
jgi:hypothetical protein